MARGPQRGDFTGAQRQKLAEDNAEQLAARQQEVGLVNQVETLIEEEGIFDPATGRVVEMSAEAQAKIEAMSEPMTMEEDPVLDPTLVVPGYNPMKDLQTVGAPQQQARVTPPNAMEVQEAPMTVEGEWRIIRVNTDIEEMTYGVGEQMTFLRGHRYRVPKHLYDWLESRGVVYH